MTPQRHESECLSDQVLLDFNTGRLADETLVQRIAEHLSWCARCDSRLTSLPDDSIVALLRAPDPLESIQNLGELSLTFSIAPTKSLARGESEPALALEGARANSVGDLPVRIDRYFVVRKLGRGGFAEVFLAKDPQRDQLVAIKTPRLDRSSTRQQRESFLREARTVATLDHTNIVPMYDCRELADGRCIVVMKYIEGETLRDAMKTRRFAAYEAADLIARVADALHYAHARHIWHRDVTPANILLDRTGRPHLADFGLALQKQDQASDAYRGAGTYHYISPEQIAGQSLVLDGRTDIWSLGVVLYELLAGQRPFRSATLDQISDEIQSQPHRPLHSVSPATPLELARICERCLHKQAGQRYATAAELAADLRAFLRRPRRRRATLIAGLAVALVLGSAATAKVINNPSPSLAPALPTGAAPSSTGGEAGASATAETWRPILQEKPVEAAWHHVGNNLYHFDAKRDRLTARHDYDRGFLSFGGLDGSDFQVRFVLTIENWKGSGGFYWALHDDRNAFPERMQRCLVLVARQVRNQPTKLELSLEEMEFVPSPLDNTKLYCKHSHQLAWTRIDLPMQSSLAFHLTIAQGKLVKLHLNGQVVEPKWEVANVAWSKISPADYGFMSFDGVVTVENASLESEESDHGEEK